MRIVKREVTREYTTVTLANSGMKKLKKFHCHSCGGVVFEYYDDIHVMIPGEIEPEDMNLPTVHICKGYIVTRDPETGFVDTSEKCTAKYIVQ